MIYYSPNNVSFELWTVIIAVATKIISQEWEDSTGKIFRLVEYYKHVGTYVYPNSQIFVIILSIIIRLCTKSYQLFF